MVVARKGSFAGAYETLTIAATALGPSAAFHTSAWAIFGPGETGDTVRWRDDGTDPTTLVGHLLAAGATLTYYGDCSKIKFIRTGATSMTLPTSYYR